MTEDLFANLIICLLVSLLIFSIVMIIVVNVIKNNKRMSNSPPKSDYETGYSDAVNKVIDILSADPAYKETIKFIVWKLKL